MNGKDLINSIMSANTQSLRYTYVALEKTSMVRMMSSKVLQTSDKLLKKEEVDRYQQYLEEEARKIRLTDDELRMEILLLLAQKTEVPVQYWDTNKGMEDFGEKVLTTVLTDYKKVDKKFQGTTFDDLIKYQLEKMFETIDKQYTKASKSAQEDYQQRVLHFIEQLPQEQQDKLRDDLGIENFSQRVIGQVLATGGASIIFSSIVNTMGFSFYMGASSLLASSAGLFGITLPFAAYTTLSSVIAVIAAPLFVIGAITFSGFYFVKQKNKLTKMMLPLTLMQLLLAYLSSESSEPTSYESIITTWRSDMEEYKRYKTERNHQLLNAEKLRKEISKKKELIDVFNKDLSSYEKNIIRLKRTMKNLLKSNANLHNVQEPKFHSCYSEIASLSAEIKVLSRKEIGIDGLWSKVKAGFVNTGNSIPRQDKQRQVEKLYDQLVDIVLAKNLNLCPTEQAEIYKKRGKMQDIKTKINKATEEKQTLTTSLNEVLATIRSLEKQIAFYEKRYYGLSKIKMELPRIGSESNERF